MSRFESGIQSERQDWRYLRFEWDSPFHSVQYSIRCRGSHWSPTFLDVDRLWHARSRMCWKATPETLDALSQDNILLSRNQ